ncbi:Cell death protease [Modicella reniformis]|uniref:Carboxypeptidase n=1 Tax=Modicella reniformis TaxID=1440133 RepID=A0A9P6ILU7_9FUNG|nr:Cell death protease [Modicella reniformis]
MRDAAKESNLFFWMVSNKHPQISNKLVNYLAEWSSSSADGYFLETGPLRFVDKKLTINKGGWHEFANVVFLDQPVGTGLSYTSQPLLRTLDEIKDHFLAFLKEFFIIFPERAKDDLYLTGESYAGTYIPYFARGILDHNNDVPEGGIAYNLKGLAIGNGWIDPLQQYKSFIPYIVKHDMVVPGTLVFFKHAMLWQLGDSMNRQTDLIAQQSHCLNDISLQERITQDKCELIVQTILEYSVVEVQNKKTCLNQYDVRLKDVYPACGLLWPSELPLLGEYLGRKDVKEALHATGTEYLISNMTWQGIQGFRNGLSNRWTVDNSPAGVWKQDRNLTYVLVYNASHMVPYDTPLAAMDMMNRFMGLDPKLQSFTSMLEIYMEDDNNSTGVGRPRGFFLRNASAVLIFVILGVGIGIFVAVKSRSQSKSDGGAQWFPLNSNDSDRGRGFVHTDELDELVVESGIHDSDDEDDDQNGAYSSQSRR